MNIDSVARSAKSGPTKDLLDDLVHDTASAMAARINNEGPRSQIQWLLAEGVSMDHIVSGLNIPEITVGDVVLAQGGGPEKIVGLVVKVSSDGGLVDVLWLSDERGVFYTDEVPGDLTKAFPSESDGEDVDASWLAGRLAQILQEHPA